MQFLCVDKFTEHAAQAIYAAKRAGQTDLSAAQAACISRRTLKRWVDRGSAGEEPYATFAGELKRIESERLNQRIASLRERRCA